MPIRREAMRRAGAPRRLGDGSPPPGRAGSEGTVTHRRPHARRRVPARVLARRWTVLVALVAVGFYTLRGVLGATPTAPAAAPKLTTTATVVQRLVVSLAPWRLPAPVSRAVVLPDGGRFVVLGGLATGDTSTSAVWQVDPGGGAASELGHLEVAVHDAAGAVLGGRFDVFGGGSSTTEGAVQSFLLGAGTRTAGELPAPRSDLTSVTIGGHAYVLGGFDGVTLPSAILATTDGRTFQTVGRLVQPVRYPAVAAVGGKIFIVGGELGTAESAISGGQTTDIQRFDPATGRTRVLGHLPVGLGHASAVVLGGKLYVLGGRNGTSLATAIWQINTGSGAATRVGTFSEARSDAAVVTLGGTAYLVGGESSGPAAPLATVVEVRLSSARATPTAQRSKAAGPKIATGARRTRNIYAADGVGRLSPVVRKMPYRIYVPESGGDSVDVIDPSTYKVVARYTTGLNPQHVVPAWDLKMLYATNDLGNSLTPINPYTGRRAGPNLPVADPYNMYFTPNGKYAIVVEEARRILAFRDPHTFKLEKALPVDCAGVDHADFSADGSFAIFSCEFSGELVKVDVRHQRVDGYLRLPRSSPQDVKLDPQGRIFYVADHNLGGVWEISAATFTSVGFIPTGRDAHGLYPSRNAKYLYVTDRGIGAISVVSFATRKVVATWHIPGGGSPDMGNVSPDGKVLWVSGRYNDCVYAISTVTGRLLAKIPVPAMPHGLAVWPEPGRYSLGHTGVMR